MGIPKGHQKKATRLEFEVFQSRGWCAFYLLSVGIFATHMALGWAKVVPAPSMGIPKGHQKKATVLGYMITAVMAAIYASFPIYTHYTTMVDGSLSSEAPRPKAKGLRCSGSRQPSSCSACRWG